MDIVGRRSFLTGAMTALPIALSRQSTKTSAPTRVAPVLNGEDRLGEHHKVGVSSTAFKVSTQDSHGDLFIMEHANQKKGGPPRHLHHAEDEWFYVLEGDYVVEVGGELFRLKAGDSALGPRGVAHAWAFIGDTPGRLLIAFAPANRMEEFFRSAANARANDAQRFRAFGMELTGPPLTIG